jgi:hypothetical protein
VLVVREGGPDEGTPLSPLQGVEKRAAEIAESSRAGNRLERGKMQARAGIQIIFDKESVIKR